MAGWILWNLLYRIGFTPAKSAEIRRISRWSTLLPVLKGTVKWSLIASCFILKSIFFFFYRRRGKLTCENKLYFYLRWDMVIIKDCGAKDYFRKKTHVCLYLYTNMPVCLHLYICMPIHLYISVSMHLGIYIYVSIPITVSIYRYINIIKYTYIQTNNKKNITSLLLVLS